SAKYISQKGADVVGYDISPAAVERARNEGIAATTRWEETVPADIYVICVSTLLAGDAPDMGPIFDVCEKIAKKAGIDTLVSIESTIIPGISRKVYDEIFKRGVALVHVPHRYWAGDPVRCGVNQMRLIGAIDDRSMRKGTSFYSDFLGIPLHQVSTIEVAEMAKVMENAYRYVQIAFVEEARMVCEDLGIDFEEVRKACNTKWNIEILEARDGIGGHCLPKDIRYFAWLNKRSILPRSAIELDEIYREYVKTRKQ
ncbi:MAG: potassium transporter TrkA, partial [Candidatus Hadarchaeales archaeon]